jgi:hypothetical protein
MKTIFLLLLSFPLIAMADTKIVRLPTYCVTIETLSGVLEKHSEQAAMTMVSSREIEGQIITSSTVLFVNFKTKTWTLVEQITEDDYCVIAVGDNITPYIK